MWNWDGITFVACFQRFKRADVPPARCNRAQFVPKGNQQFTHTQSNSANQTRGGDNHQPK